MPLLTIDAILAARKSRLQAAAVPVVSTVAVSFGLPAPQLNAIATPPSKKIFSILSWNIKDYKGSKIVASKKGKENNPFINQFVKVVSEKLHIDLMMLIETDIDLTEAVARVEDERDDLFGHQATAPTVPSPIVDDPREDEKRKRDDTFYADVGKRVEALSAGPDSKYTAVGSEMAYRKVNLPPSFTLAELQNDYYKHPHGPVDEDGLPWWTYLESVGRCYDVDIKGIPTDITQLIHDFPTLPASKLDKDVVFRLKTGCDECAGSGALVATAVCSLCRGHGKAMDFHCRQCGATGKLRAAKACVQCKGARVTAIPCACQGKGSCDGCAGSGRAKCGSCGGPRTVECPQCRGNGVVSSHTGTLACSYCQGAGHGMIIPRCFACVQGYAPCAICKGSGKCGACGGSGMAGVDCSGCKATGTVEAIFDCGNCTGLGYNPEYACQHCKGARSSACTGCAGSSCTICGGAGKLDCVQCNATGVSADAACSQCADDPHHTPCPTCAATGLYDPAAEEHTLQILRLLLSPKTFSNIDVETYTLLWRAPGKVLPPRVMGNYMLACDNKAVWLNRGNAELCSKDALGKELGYQDPLSAFNSRSPFVVPLVMDLNGKKRQDVALVLFHAIWGEVKGLKAADKTRLVKARADSIRLLGKLGVPTASSGIKAVGDVDCSILVGDFNIDYNGGKAARDKYNTDVKKHAAKVFSDLLADGYLAPVGGTQTGLTTRDTGIDRLQGAGNQDIHTYGYDNFLIKGADLQGSVVNCGVFDVLGLIESLLAKDTALVSWIDNDYMSAPPSKPKKPRTTKPGKTPPKAKPVKTRKPFTNNRVRAFYLYYEYISDHLPIILDLLVDEVDPQYQAHLQEQEAFIQKPIEKPPLRMLGHWNSLGLSSAPPSVTVATPPSAHVCGVAKVVCFPDLIGVAIEPGLLFYGACKGLNPSALLGKQVEGDFEPGNTAYVDQAHFMGNWAGKLAVTTNKSWFTQRVDDKKRAIRGRIKWFDIDGNIAIACWIIVGSEKVKRIFQGRGEFSVPVQVGDWIEGIFEFKG